MKCRHDNVSGMNFVDVTWQPPMRPGGQIEFYNVTDVEAVARHFVDKHLVYNQISILCGFVVCVLS